jgi:Tfp pilus assembly protein PilV
MGDACATRRLDLRIQRGKGPPTLSEEPLPGYPEAMNIKLLLVAVTVLAASTSHAEQLRREQSTRRRPAVLVPSNDACVAMDADQTTLSLCMDSLITYLNSAQLRDTVDAAVRHSEDNEMFSTRYALAGRELTRRAEAARTRLSIPLNAGGLGSVRLEAGEVYRDGMIHHTAARRAASNPPGSPEHQHAVSVMRIIAEAQGSSAGYGEAMRAMSEERAGSRNAAP